MCRKYDFSDITGKGGRLCGGVVSYFLICELQGSEKGFAVVVAVHQWWVVVGPGTVAGGHHSLSTIGWPVWALGGEHGAGTYLAGVSYKLLGH